MLKEYGSLYFDYAKFLEARLNESNTERFNNNDNINSISKFRRLTTCGE